MKAVKANVKFEKENKKTPLKTISTVYFPLVRLFTQVFSRTSTNHPGIFRGRALSSDSASPRTNTIASRDQFKPMRIRENLVVNYKLHRRATAWNLFANLMCYLSFPVQVWKT